MVLLIFVFYNFKSHSAVNTKIIAKVGTNIITSYELENKIRTILFLSKKEIVFIADKPWTPLPLESLIKKVSI